MKELQTFLNEPALKLKLLVCLPGVAGNEMVNFSI